MDALTRYRLTETIEIERLTFTEFPAGDSTQFNPIAGAYALQQAEEELLRLFRGVLATIGPGAGVCVLGECIHPGSTFVSTISRADSDPDSPRMGGC